MNPDRPGVLILGGYGVFGGQVARMLARDGDKRVLIGGRSGEKAAAFAAELGPGAAAGIAVDATKGIGPALAATGARMVVHAAGPFQGQDYGVARACIDSGVDYVDLADGRAFVEGLSTLDDAARRGGSLAVTGASSVPGLSSTVVEHLSQELAELRHITIGITPGNRAPRGPAVVSAILGAAGHAMPRWQGGRMIQVRAWGGLRRHRLALPDGTSIGSRWFADWDVPDNVIFPPHYRVRDAVRFQAGLELKVMHFGLWGLSLAVRARLVPSLAPLAPMMLAVANMLKPFGTDRGGMFVDLTGLDRKGNPRRLRWTLIAGSGAGPLVPSIPAVILVRKRLAETLSANGAKPCLGLFTVGEFEDAVRGLDIRCGIEELAPD